MINKLNNRKARQQNNECLKLKSAKYVTKIVVYIISPE